MIGYLPMIDVHYEGLEQIEPVTLYWTYDAAEKAADEARKGRKRGTSSEVLEVEVPLPAEAEALTAKGLMLAQHPSQSQLLGAMAEAE